MKYFRHAGRLITCGFMLIAIGQMMFGEADACVAPTQRVVAISGVILTLLFLTVFPYELFAKDHRP